MKEDLGGDAYWKETLKLLRNVLILWGVKTRMQAALEAGRWGYGKSSSNTC